MKNTYALGWNADTNRYHKFLSKKRLWLSGGSEVQDGGENFSRFLVIGQLLTERPLSRSEGATGRSRQRSSGRAVISDLPASCQWTRYHVVR